MEGKDSLRQPFTDNFVKHIASEVMEALIVHFRAGQEQARQEGRKEIVDFIKLCFPMTINASPAWQEKLKEWELR